MVDEGGGVDKSTDIRLPSSLAAAGDEGVVVSVETMRVDGVGVVGMRGRGVTRGGVRGRSGMVMVMGRGGDGSSCIIVREVECKYRVCVAGWGGYL